MTYVTRIKKVTVRMTYREHERLLKQAAKLNLNMSDYIRIFVPDLLIRPTKGNK